MDLQHWELGRFKPYANNPRKNDAVVDRMVKSIAEFGFRMPVVVKSDGTVVDGHLRLKAAKQIGMTQIPVVLADELTDEQVRAFRLLANRSANWAEWDTELLAIELTELDLENFDLELTGFDDAELDLLLIEEDEKPQTDYQSPQIFTRPDATAPTDYNRYSYGDRPGEDDDDEPEDEPEQSTTAIGGNYPLAIVLPFADYQRWKAYKEAIGIKRDTTAFLKLLEEVT
jgi:hypothetical protein